MSCLNKCCSRPIDRSMQNLNKTQTEYCSLYCYLFVRNELTMVKMSESKHHKGLFKFPTILRNCENCGGDVELQYVHNKANKSFCSRECRTAGQGLNGRRGLLRFQIMKLLRDSPRDWWTSSDLARVLDNKQMVHTLNGHKMGGLLRYCKEWLETRRVNHITEWRFRKDFEKYPLVALMRGDFR